MVFIFTFIPINGLPSEPFSSGNMNSIVIKRAAARKIIFFSCHFVIKMSDKMTFYFEKESKFDKKKHDI